jgi:hypothetical protein
VARPDALEEVFLGVVPDHETVVALTTALSESDFYVQRVVENPPRPGGQPGQRMRSWDIAGRLYRSVYPIDFHVRISGVELSRLGGRAETGTAKAVMSVRGAYVDSEMELQVQVVKDQLQALVGDTLKRLRRRLIELPEQGDGGMGRLGLDPPDDNE